MSQEMVIITPENAEIRMPLAGIFSRGGAFAYDVCIQLVVLFGASILLTFSTPFVYYGFGGMFSHSLTSGIYLIVCLLWSVGYYLYFELYSHGRTPGKKAFGIRVIMVNGQDVRFFSSLLRNILKLADFLPAFFLAAVFSTVLSENHQRIGDLLANTVVVRDENV